MTNDKYTVMLDYLRQCPAMQGVLGFQTVDAQDGSLRVLTTGADAEYRRTYIDGSVLRRFDFTIEFYRTMSYVPYVEGTPEPIENIQDILDVQELIDWIDDQKSAQNFPEFGAGYVVDSITPMNDQPNLAWLDAVNYDPPLAKYTVNIRVEYMDYTRAI